MKEPEKKESPVKVELGAKAEAKLNVDVTVPEESTGRTLDALTDIIRPWTEARGLKADLIRLQREEVVLEVARIAAERLAIENASVHAVPLKVLVPLLENASNEAADDDYMIDRWADLLSSAAKQIGVEPRFVQIMSELNGTQAKLLEDTALGNMTEWKQDRDPVHIGSLRPINALDHLVGMRDFEYIFELIENSDHTKRFDISEELLGMFQNTVEKSVGISLKSVRVTSGPASRCSAERKYSNMSINLEVLESLNLIRSTQLNWTRTLGVILEFYQVTYFGLSFLLACSEKVRMLVEKQK